MEMTLESDGFNIRITEGELGRNKESKEDRIKDDKDEGNVIGKVDC